MNESKFFKNDTKSPSMWRIAVYTGLLLFVVAVVYLLSIYYGNEGVRHAHRKAVEAASEIKR